MLKQCLEKNRTIKVVRGFFICGFLSSFVLHLHAFTGRRRTATFSKNCTARSQQIAAPRGDRTLRTHIAGVVFDAIEG
jgi:hypothetical protein